MKKQSINCEILRLFYIVIHGFHVKLVTPMNKELATLRSHL